MALDRRVPRLPYTDPGICRYCQQPVLKLDGTVDRRRTWHRGDRGDTNCVAEHLKRDPGMLRKRIWERDGGVCANCGYEGAGLHELSREFYERKSFGGGQRKIPDDVRWGWHADHIVALEDGGGHGDTNVQTLCVPCHRRKTAGENRLRSAR